MGYKVLSAINRKSTLNSIQSTKPDLIFLDLHLPDIPGTKILENLKNDKNTQDIPVILLRASEEKTILQVVDNYKTNSYVVKPFKSDVIQETTQKFLS